MTSMNCSRQASRLDHVGLYLIEHFAQSAPKLPDHEIAEAGFFKLDSLPEAATPATRRRLAEVFGRTAPSPYW